MSDEPIETECPTCGYLCEHDGKEYTPVRIYTDAVTPNWDAMTAEEIAQVIESAPVVLGEWKDTARGGAERLSRGCVRGGASIWPAAWPDDGTGWWWRMHGVGPPPSPLRRKARR